jgi:hypothetical protein
MQNWLTREHQQREYEKFCREHAEKVLLLPAKIEISENPPRKVIKPN